MKRIIPLGVLIFWFGCLHAQNSSPELLSTAGETFQSNTLHLDWSMGEIAVQTIGNEDLQITQGFHQPHYVTTSVNELSKEIGKVSVYPNPTIDEVNIQLDLKEYRKVNIVLLDASGKIIHRSVRNGNTIHEHLRMQELPSSTYFIHLHDDKDQFLKILKINKIN